MKFMTTLSGASIFAFSLYGNATAINFDDPGIVNPLNDFYAADGVFFEFGDWGATGGYGETSNPNFGLSFSGDSYVSMADGFTDYLNFSYGSFSDATISIFDGLGGAGTLLTTQILPANDIYSFDHISIPFTGTARSVTVSANWFSFGWDDLQFSNRQQAVPIPSVLSLLGFALAAIGINNRKMRRDTAP